MIPPLFTTSWPPSPSARHAPSRVARKLKLVLRGGVGFLLIALILAAAWGASTPQGQSLLRDPAEMQRVARIWTADHALLAPIAFLFLYALMAFAALPIWPLQIVAGAVFGLTFGILHATLAAAITAVLMTRLGAWIGGDALARKLEAALPRLQRIRHRLGDHGLLVVLAIRLLSITPFGLCNYFFSLAGLRLRDVFVASLLGGLPAISIYVTLGATPTLLADWRYYIGLALGTGLLLLPVYRVYRAGKNRVR